MPHSMSIYETYCTCIKCFAMRNVLVIGHSSGVTLQQEWKNKIGTQNVNGDIQTVDCCPIGTLLLLLFCSLTYEHKANEVSWPGESCTVRYPDPGVMHSEVS